MSIDVDFSQFRRKEPNANLEETDFSQFKRKPEMGSYEKFIERPAQIGLQGAAAGLRAIPRTAYDLLKTFVSATGGDISKLESAEQNAPDWLKKISKKVFPSFEEVREKQKEKQTFVGKKQAAQPEGPIEKGIEKFGRFVGESPAFGGIGGAKGAAALGGLAAGTQVAEEAELGPIGTLLSGVVGSLVPGGVTGLAKSIKSPKKLLAKGAASFTPKDQLALQKSIIEDARKAGIQLDVGSLTNSKILQGIQTKLSQSSLTGKALDDLKKNLSQQVINEYKNLSENLGRAQFETIHDAGEALQNSLKLERDLSQKQYREVYNGAKKRLNDTSVVYPDKVIKTIERLESELKPGSLKGTEQKAVLQFIQDLKKDVMTAEGNLKGAKVKDLINDKIAIHDIVDYELEGGTKQLLKTLAKEIDETVQQYGRVDPQFARDYKLADKKFAEHAKTFRNKNIASSLKSQDPRQVLAKMNTTQGIRDVKRALQKSKEAKDLFKDLSRFKLDQIVEKSLEQGTSNQIKFGKFGSTLSKGNNRELVKELLGPENFNRLDKLMKTSSRIADSANKFLNTSQSATNLIDLTFAGKLLSDIAQLFGGNPWPFFTTGGSFLTARQLSSLLANPEFLKAVEDAILASGTNNITIMKRAADKLLRTSESALRAVGEIPKQGGLESDDNQKIPQ